MPPFLPRKRSTSPRTVRQPPTKKPKLADALDGETTKNEAGHVKAVFSVDSDSTSDHESDSDSDSTLSDVDSEQFEDIATSPRDDGDDDDDDEEGEEIEWEDTALADAPGQSKRVALADGPIQLTFRKEEDDIDYAAMSSAAKKGPSRREKQARIDTHKLHVQFLLWHNATRNSWISDQEVQKTLREQLPPQIIQEVEKWKRASGLSKEEPSKAHSKVTSSTRKSKKHKSVRNQRDWGNPSQRLEAGKPDMSHGDPLISLMKVLAAYWKKRFAITAPGLRKRGYSTKLQLKRDIQSYRNDEHDPEKHGERIKDLESFREIAKRSEGSRDAGAQLFTALIRALGIEARLVASLQPAGFGWTKAEQMLPRKATDGRDITVDDPKAEQGNTKTVPKKSVGKKQQRSRPSRTKNQTIVLDTDGEIDEITSEAEDDDSVVDVTISMSKQRKPRYDRELAFPIYWTEAISPITHKVLPVSPLVLENPVASTSETLSTFEPRGAKADKTHQVIAYVVAHSSDGSAKDVTVRYLRKNLWPGRTKGFRFPVEKVPLYDRTGRIRKYENYDWFKHVMSSYGRSTHMRTATDDIEDATDLVPAQPEKKENTGVDTLQSLKASTDFVLERFLRREEALKPGAKIDRMFVSGKGDNVKEEPVYLRADVERCLTAESWHKEGRRPLLGETPMKLVPVRAVTLTRKREAEEHERVTGEKQMQGLYSWDQTEWIIPEPIRDGIIPKNSYGNMDCFVPSMVPQGAVHIPLKGTVRICKKLEVDFAEAVTGFEFGNKRAVPVCTGVVVAKENEKAVREAWKVYNEEQRRKEESKMEKLVLDTWKKFLIGLRIRERVAAQYGGQLNLDDGPTGLGKDDPITLDSDNDEKVTEIAATANEPGGFFADEDEEMGGGFLLPHEDDVSEAGELLMEEEESTKQEKDSSSILQYPTPASMVTKVGDVGEKSAKPKASITTSLPRNDLEGMDIKAGDSTASATNGPSHPDRRKDHFVIKHGDSELSADIEVDTNPSEANGIHDGNITSDPDGSENDNSETYVPRSTKRPRLASSKRKRPSTPDPKSSRKAASLKSTTPSAKGRLNQKRDQDVATKSTPASSRRSRRKTTTLTSPYFEVSE